MIDISTDIDRLYIETTKKIKELREGVRCRVIEQCPYKIGDMVQCNDFEPGEILRIYAQKIESDVNIYEWGIAVENKKMGVIFYTESNKDDIKLIKSRAKS